MLYCDWFYFVNDNEEVLYFLVVDVVIGEIVWCVDCEEKSNWLIFFVWEYEGCMEVVMLGIDMM